MAVVLYENDKYEGAVKNSTVLLPAPLIQYLVGTRASGTSSWSAPIEEWSEEQ